MSRSIKFNNTEVGQESVNKSIEEDIKPNLIQSFMATKFGC